MVPGRAGQQPEERPLPTGGSQKGLTQHLCQSLAKGEPQLQRCQSDRNIKDEMKVDLAGGSERENTQKGDFYAAII